MGASGNEAYIPVLVDLLHFPLRLDVWKALYSSLSQLTGEEENSDRGWWAEWLGVRPEIRGPDGYAAWKGRLFALFDPAIGAFLYDGVKARIRIEEIVWGGVGKDGIPDLRDPRVVPADEARYLNPEDRVFGVSINGEHRAYPLRILNAHEMANDEVGGVPFALAY